MKAYILNIILMALWMIPTGLSAQTSSTGSINEGSVSDQFDYVIKASSNWKDERGRVYEVIRRNMMENLKKNSVDSISAVRSDLHSTQAIVRRQQTEIDTLQKAIGRIRANLDASISEKDSMSFLGVSMSKGGYKFLVWAIIAGLLGLLGFFIFKFKNSNLVTQSAQSKYEKIEQEFSEHKRKALEREQKIKRQLQDEINKNRG